MDITKFYASRTRHIFSSEVRDILKWITSDVISFGGGIPDPNTFPVQEIKEALNNALDKYGASILQYSKTTGIDDFKIEICKFMERRGIISKAQPENVVVTCGSQEGLHIIAELFINPGDIVITEEPTYLAMLQVLNLFEADIVGIPMDENGLKTDVLEETVRKLINDGKKVKFIYTVSICQNPTGITMGCDRRKHLLEIAEEYDLLIIEDDPYSYILYEDINVKPIKAYDINDRVIYISTFSKILAPGLRVGWIYANQDIVNILELGKQISTLHASTISQIIAYELLKNGVIERRLPELRKYYRMKRDVMLNALEEYMPSNVEWTKPIGGMFIWLTLPEKINTSKLLPKAIREYKVAYVPGVSFYPKRNKFNNMRLNFTYPKPEQIIEGVKRLSKLIKDELEKQ